MSETTIEAGILWLQFNSAQGLKRVAAQLNYVHSENNLRQWFSSCHHNRIWRSERRESQPVQAEKTPKTPGRDFDELGQAYLDIIRISPCPSQRDHHLTKWWTLVPLSFGPRSQLLTPLIQRTSKHEPLALVIIV